MRTFPNTVIITLVLLGIVAVIWIIFGITVVANLHPAFPAEPFFRWGIGIIATFAGLLMGGLVYLLRKRKRFAWWLVLTGLFLFALATILDDVGLIDLVIAGFTLIPAVLLIKDRRWYLQGKTG
jgi:hypothetical protein